MNHRVHNRLQPAAFVAAAIAAMLLGGCQARPVAVPTAGPPMTFLAPVMSPARARIETANPEPRTEAAPVRIQFVPMFAAASTAAFAPRELSVQPDGVLVGASADAARPETADIDFYPMFASISSPGRWTALLDIGDSAIVRQRDGDSALAGAENEQTPR